MYITIHLSQTNWNDQTIMANSLYSRRHHMVSSQNYWIAHVSSATKWHAANISQTVLEDKSQWGTEWQSAKTSENVLEDESQWETNRRAAKTSQKYLADSR
jgi:hypothetical protein